MTSKGSVAALDEARTLPMPKSNIVRKPVTVTVGQFDYVAKPGGKVLRDYHIIVLCDDGSVWRSLTGKEWERVPDVPAFG